MYLLWRGSRMVRYGQIGRCLDDPQQIWQEAELYREQTDEEAHTQQLCLQQRRCTPIECQCANAELTVDHQPDDVEVDRSARAGPQGPGEQHGTDHTPAFLR